MNASTSTTRTTFEVAAATVTAVTRSGLLRPVPPFALARSARAVRRHGSNTSVLLALSAARWPNRAAIIDDTGTVTYRELQARVDGQGRILAHRHGIGPGDAVGVLCRNSADFVAAMLGATAIGADVVLLNTDFNPPALSAALTGHQIRLVVADDEFASKLAGASAPLIVLDAGDLETPPSQPATYTTKPGKIVLLTSGTTGTPKGVPRTPAPTQVLGVAATVLNRTQLRSGSRVAIGVPFFHAFGMASLTLALTLGGTVLTRRRFDAETTLAQASLHRADALTAVPIMLNRILDLPDNVRDRNPVPALRVVISGGAPLDPALGQRFMDAFGDVLYNGYGSSEVGLGSLATPAELRRAPSTVGRPVAGSPVQVLDEHDQPVSPGTIGRVFVGGALTFDGYTGGARKPVVSGKIGTGDMGYLDEHGCLYIVGREDDMIVSGGENVYPQAVGNLLAEHPDINDHAVIGVPDDTYGQRLAAFVVPNAGVTLDEDRIREYLKRRVARFEQPRDISIVTDIPRNPTGKVLRHELAGADSARPAQ